MKRKKGFINLEEYEFSEECYEEEGNHCHGWFLKDGVEYLYKKYSIETAYKEVFYATICDFLKIPNVGYDLACLDDTQGVITKDYTDKNTKRLMSIKFAILKYVAETNYKDEPASLYSLDGMKSVFSFVCKQNKMMDCADALYQEFLQQFILQILFANCDLHSENIEIIKKEDGIHLSPIYDLGSCGVINLNGLKGKDNHYSLKKNCPKDFSEHPKITIQYFLSHSPREEIEMFKKYLELCREIRTLDVIDFIEYKTENKVPYGISRKLRLKYKQNLKTISTTFFK